VSGLPRGSWRRTALCVALAAAALAPGALGRELMAPDEPRFAVVARETAERGEFLVPHHGGRPYLNKPPLLIWLEMLLFRAFGGPSEATARVPSLLAALGAVALTHRAGRRWFGEPAATRGTLMLVAAPLFLMRGAWVATDPLLLAATLGAVVALDRAGAGWRAGGPLAALALALGVLAKGPVALLWPALAALAAQGLAGVRVSLRPLLQPVPLAVLAAVAGLPMALTAERLGLEPLLAAAWRESGQRFLASWDNLRPFWYYPPKLFTGFFPWSLVGLAALVPEVRRKLPPDPRRTWLLRWTVLGVLLFSIPGSKRLVYLLPLLPALALVTASILPALGAAVRARRATGALIALGAAVGLAMGLALGLAPGVVPGPESLAVPEVRRAAAAFLLAGAASLALVAAGLARGRGGVAGGAALLALASGLLAPWTAAAVRAGAGASRLGAVVRQAVGPGTPVAFGANKGDLAAWYSGFSGPIVTRPREAALFLAGEPPRAAVGEPEELGPPSAWPPGARVAAEGRVGSEAVLVLRRDAAPVPAPVDPDRSGPGR
jgi:4-amino-4-deoxy-L-arabinose transferase-like glycosyltransferase